MLLGTAKRLLDADTRGWPVRDRATLARIRAPAIDDCALRAIEPVVARHLDPAARRRRA